MSKKKKRKRDMSSSSSSEDEAKKRKKRSRDKKKRKKKSRSSSSDSGRERERRKSSKKKLKTQQPEEAEPEEVIGPQIPSSTSGPTERPKMAPMTKEEWDKRQSQIRRVLDEETGRYRLIKGDGEVLEEIVSYEKHKEINRAATVGDGLYFQSKLPQSKRF